jgi:hypothetical protein
MMKMIEFYSGSKHSGQTSAVSDPNDLPNNRLGCSTFSRKSEQPAEPTPCTEYGHYVRKRGHMASSY